MTNSITKRVAITLSGLTAAAIMALSGTAGAIGEGQIAGGDIYRSKNFTKNGEFSDTTFADKCETVQYKIRLHNPGPTSVTNVNVKVNLPNTVDTTNVSTATITSQNSQPSTVSDTTTVKLSTAQKIDYLSGSTELLDTYSKHIANLPDGILGGGVNIGTVGVSLNEIKFVQFKAKVDCPKPPCEDNPNTPEDECHPCVDNPETPNDECNPCKDNPNTPEDECNPCVDNPKTSADECNPQPPKEQPKKPKSLPNTGPGAVLASFVGISSISALLHQVFVRRRQS